MRCRGPRTGLRKLFQKARCRPTVGVLLTVAIGAGLAQAQVPAAGLAEVNGTQLYYEMTGSGHPLVLLHGGGADGRLWDGQFEEFAQHFRVIRYDLRGAGKSEIPQTRFSNREDLYALLEYLNVDKAYLVGVSRGGGIAFDLATIHPEKVAALVLVSSNLSAPVDVYHDMIASAQKAGREEGVARAAEIWSSDPYQGPVQPNLPARQKVYEIMRENLGKFLYFWGGAISSEPGLPPRGERLSEVRAPTLVISGDRDAEQARANYARWGREIPGARIVHVPGAAHLVNMDQPEEFMRIVMEFLQSL